MLAFWDVLLEPLIDALRPRHIVEVGADKGETTRALVTWAESRRAVVHVIDPKPNFDVDALESRHPQALVFHRAPSLEVLPGLDPVDLALIDGDHNHHTVLNELRVLERLAHAAGAPPPVIALHDIGWPYGRRDLYYEPERIPAEARRPFERRGMRPDSDELVDDGLNAHLANAKVPAPRHSGVLGAIEDFMAESRTAWRLFEVPGQHGLGVVAPNALLEEHVHVRDLLETTGTAAFLRARVAAVELERIEGVIRRERTGRAPRAGAKTPAELEEQLDETERRARRLRRQRDAAEEREAQLENELVTERRSARALRLELETTVQRGERAVDRLAELEEAAHAAQALADRTKAASERAEAAHTQLVAELEERRKDIERALDEARAQAERDHREADAASGALEERSIELQRAQSDAISLRAALGRAQANAEIARIERDALELRLRDLASLHETTLDLLEAPGRVAATAPEREAIARFTSEYKIPAGAGTDRLALPAARDRRGVLVPPGGAPHDDRPTVDVVVCVHDALADVQRCLWSLVEKGSYPFHLTVVNDGSDSETTSWLESTAANQGMTLLHNECAPHGYTIAANIGLKATTADYVVLLNSDTIVTYGWLERIVACGQSDERIGIIGPLSNAASHQSVPALRASHGWATNPLPVFATEDGVAKLLEQISASSRPRVPFINGFCYALKRSVLEAVGLFDEENFASGYCEENDYSYRAAQAGFELAVADDCYVFHAKSRSYGAEAREAIARRNYERFLHKHGPERIQALVADLESDTTLAPLRSEVMQAMSSREAFARALLAGEREPLSIAFVLPGLGVGGSGGSHSIYQETLGLRRLGVPARILLAAHAWDRAMATYEDAQDLFEPFVDVDDLAEKTADADVISATHFKSLALVAALHERRDDFIPAYYIQDYEPFIIGRDSPDLQEARESYEAIPGCLLFAKTHWLCNIVGQRHDQPVGKVAPSLDTELFRPPARRRGPGPLRVVAMVRPRTPRRQPTATCVVLDALIQLLGDAIEVVTFGCTQDELAQVTVSDHLRAGHRGVLSRQAVAGLLRETDVFVDMSIYQAFGRTALEAMACGCAVVVPRLGGCAEFAVDGVNARTVDTLDPDQAVAAISDLATDRERLARMQEAARRTSERFSIDRAALSEYLLFSWEHARRFAADHAAT